ncbi:hypothetical protein H8L32_05165 [Undibacterium sp. CY18W]|uniref:Bacteriocin-type signal sequence-containing protein n=1 Tax=Undibacterium hunanense TaxID=2762292 RepID=A0ABR6ZLU1_9BURK|nr:hypothetical protein [Undibacterium hunanense]MBC3916858.1 hypothetical protein [Undibacterium hunanense]
MKNTGNTCSHSTLNKSDTGINQRPSDQEIEMRMLTDSEILNVGGGPEVDVESQGGGG